MADVLLLSPPAPVWTKGVVAPPLGLGYIASILRNHGISVNVVDLFDRNFEESAHVIRQNKPRVVGITCNTGIRHESLKLAAISKELFPETPVILGGPHATALPHQILANYFAVDIIVRNEGESTFLELVETYFKEGFSPKALKAINGISFRAPSSNAIVHTEDREFIKDLDALPFPAWDQFQIGKYASYEDLDEATNRLRKAPLITSRGCPYNCAFCYGGFWGRKYRMRSPQNVVDEIEYLYDKFGVRYIRFFDDNFHVSKRRTMEICKEILERGLDVLWRAEGRVDSADMDVYAWMKRAGCHMIELGVESGSQTILDNINKGTTRGQIKDAFKIARKVGLETKAFIMIGNPGETETSIMETVALLKEINPTYVIHGLTWVMPNTKLYYDMLKSGKMDESIWLRKDVIFPVYTEEHSYKALMKLYFKFYIQYFFLHKKAVRKLVQDLFTVVGNPVKIGQ